jgi:superoxide reductase
MQKLAENSVDASLEKHVPVTEQTDAGILVKVGSVPHPIERAHYIKWIEMIDGAKVCRKHLEPGDAPEALFPSASPDAIFRAYCNVHGLWKNK